jgi:hypothetical protein
MNTRLTAVSLAVLASLALAGCGGGGGGGGATLSGTVAVGAPLAGATVEVTDANGVTRSTTAAADGTYSISTAGLVAPLVIRATGDLGDSVVRLSSAVASLETSTTANVTPITEAVVASIATGYDTKSITPSGITASGLSSAMGQILTAVSNVATAVGYRGTNPIQDAFSTDATGLDALLDAVAIKATSAGVNIVNKGKAISDAQTPETVVVSTSGSTVSVSGQLSTPDALLGTKLLALQQKINACFAVSAQSRLTVLYTDSAGERTPDDATLSAACSSFVSTGYRHNGKSFALRWVDDLAAAQGATLADTEPSGSVSIVPRFAIPTATADVFEYVVDITWKDKDGVGYARPEVLRLNGQGDLELYGNRRGYNMFVEPTITVINAKNSTHADGQSSNRTEGRLRILANPYLSGGAYQYTTTPAANVPSADLVPSPTLGCVWLTGRHISGITNHDPSSPKGGILLKTPHTSVTGSQNYMAIARQYVASFDPLNDQTHLNRLLTDCEVSADAFGNSFTDERYTTWRTNSNYTIDLLVPTGSDFAFDGTDSDTNALRYSTDGHGPVFAPAMLSPAERQAADQISLPRYTFYVLGRTVPTSPDGTSAPVAQFKDRTAPYLLEVMNTRMIRALPTLTDGANIVTPTLSDAVIAQYLRSEGSGVGQVDTLSVNWTNTSDVWAQRLGTSSFYRRDARRVFPPSRVSESFKVKKTESSKEVSLSTPLPPFAAVNGQYGNPPVDIYAVYREIWLRGVDSGGRQIQPVWSYEQLR